MLTAEQKQIDEIFTARIKYINDVREIAKKFLMPDFSNVPKEQKGSPEILRKLADATAAIEVISSVFNIFGALSGSKTFSSEQAITDLVFALNTNQFWVKNAGYLMPLVNAAINAHLDNRELRTQQEPLWEYLEYHNKNAWLEILPAVVFCLNGYPEMRKVSLEFKKSFEPLVR